jgi:uncharacterized LabA/DUF88 family protein
VSRRPAPFLRHVVTVATRMRVAVFIDQQNLYKSARDAYRWHAEPSLRGNALPLDLSRLLATGALAQAVEEGDDVSARELVAIRVCMGQPSQRHDGREYARALRQRQHWDRSSPLVVIRHRTLRYPRNWQPGDTERPREKGIDVLLAMELVRGACDPNSDCKFDLAILVSGDTDLLPAVEFVIAQKGTDAIQCATPAPIVDREGRRLTDPPAPLRASMPNGQATNRTISIPQQAFERVADRTNHYESRSAQPYEPGAYGRRRRPDRR